MKLLRIVLAVSAMAWYGSNAFGQVVCENISIEDGIVTIPRDSIDLAETVTYEIYDKAIVQTVDGTSDVYLISQSFIDEGDLVCIIFDEFFFFVFTDDGKVVKMTYGGAYSTMSGPGLTIVQK